MWGWWQGGWGSGWCLAYGGFAFGGGQVCEVVVRAASVVGVLDPGDDCDAQLVSGCSSVPVENRSFVGD